MEQMTEEMKLLEKRLDDNREEIDRLLHFDLPLDLLYIRINFLNDQNQKLIDKLRLLQT